MSKIPNLHSFLGVLACAFMLSACSTTPGVVSTVTLEPYPSPCNATTGFLQNDNAPGYAQHETALAPNPVCAIADVTLVPGSAHATAGPNIFLLTTFDEVRPGSPTVSYIADYRLPAPLPAAPSQQVVFHVIAAMAAPPNGQGATGLKLGLGNNVDVANVVCTVSIAAEQVNC